VEYGDGSERVIVWFFKVLLLAGLIVGAIAFALALAARGGL